MRPIIYLTVFLILMSCNDIQPIEKLNKEQTITEVNQMLDDYHKDIKAEGLTAEFKYLDESDDFFWVPPEYDSALSYDSVKSILETNAKAFQTVIFKFDTLEIIPLTNEIATYYGIVNGQMIDTAKVESNMSILESGTLIKRKSGWKLLSGQSVVLN